MINTDEFTTGYIECAIWASTDSNGAPLDRNYDVDRIAKETLSQMREDCANFQAANHELLTAAYEHPTISYNESQAGQDFWLTRNGEGAGFWDRSLGKIGKDLTAASKLYKETLLYVGDDGQIYGS
jgi:hypothetical protein